MIKSNVYREAQAFLKNIRLSCKGLQGTDPLAYFPTMSVMKKNKVFEY